MIIGCLGKGGSGKSTIATLLTNMLVQHNKYVLAIDADHNMDLSHNLNAPLHNMSFIGSSLPQLLSYVGLSESEKYYDILFKPQEPSFSFAKDPDIFTSTYAFNLSERLSIMTAGPHTDNVLYGKNCSHSLATPLKVYLPFLTLSEHSYVIVDEKAGSDGAGTGVCTGFDVACIMTEPTEHGIKAANQIAELLDYFGTPYVFVGNKIMDETDKEFIRSLLKSPPVVFFDHDKAMRQSELTEKTITSLHDLLTHLSNKNMENRKERSRKKFERNKSFAKHLV